MASFYKLMASVNAAHLRADVTNSASTCQQSAISSFYRNMTLAINANSLKHANIYITACFACAVIPACCLQLQKYLQLSPDTGRDVALLERCLSIFVYHDALWEETVNFVSLRILIHGPISLLHLLSVIHGQLTFSLSGISVNTTANFEGKQNGGQHESAKCRERRWYILTIFDNNPRL